MHFEAVSTAVRVLSIIGKAAYADSKEKGEDPSGARRIGQAIVDMLTHAENDVVTQDATNVDYNLVESAKAFFEAQYAEFNEKDLW